MSSMVKKIISVVISIVFLVAGYFASDYLPGYMKASTEYKELIAYHFINFGTAIHAFHDDLGELLSMESPSNSNDTNDTTIEKTTLNAFQRSNFGVSSITSGPIDCDYTFMLSDSIGVIKQICADEKLVPSERHYIEALYAYTGELIKLHDQKLGNCKGDRALIPNADFEAFEKSIFTVYSDFSKLADEKLELKPYAFLKTYQGDFASANFEQAQKECVALFSKLAPGQTLKYDNRDEPYTRLFVFRTHEEMSDPFLMTTTTNFEENQYTVYYDKVDGQIEFSASSYSMPDKAKTLSDSALDDFAIKTVKSINPNATLEKRTVKRFVKENPSYTVRYVFTNGIECELESYGFVSHLKLSKVEVE